MITNSIFNLLLWFKMRRIKHFLWKPLIRKTHDPKATQHALLKHILHANQETNFGKQYNFSHISSYEDFKNTVPVKSYEDLRSYIEKQEREQKPYLNTSQPLMYAQTSGTTGKPKYIPILKNTIEQYRQSQHTFAYTEYKDIPGVYDGKVLAIVSPAEEGRLKTGTPYGSMSGLIYQSMPKFLYAKYVVPPKIFEITDYDLKYYLIAAFALREKNITLIATANPSTILKIHTVIHDRWDELIKALATGNGDGLVANPDRAAELATLKSEKEQLHFADLWPNLKSVTAWTGGNCAALIPSVKKLLHPSTKIVEMGYLSSEFRGSIPVNVLQNKNIPTIHENFFEFVEREAWENKRMDFLTVEKLETRKQYYVFVTTQNGLYRYFINDIIEAGEKFNNTPTIHFIQKGKGVINLTGEKLNEFQVLTAMQDLKKALNVEFDFFIMVGCPQSLQYTLYIEAMPFENASYCFEKHLSKLNIEFTAKRQSGRLKKTVIVLLKPKTAELYKKHCIENGQREGQFKIVRLQHQEDCSFDFEKHARK